MPSSFSQRPVPGEIYRFRSLDALIGTRKELQYQTIYLAKPDQMNDLAEDTVNVVWRGSDKLWSNFITLYWKSLIASTATNDLYIPGYNRILDEDFEIKMVVDNAINDIHQEYADNKSKLISESLTNRNVSYQNLPHLLDIVTPRNIPISLLGRSVYATSWHSMPQFSHRFVQAIGKSVVSDFRFACFTEDFTNPYLWSEYGVNNTGACLVFDRKELQKLASPTYSGAIEIRNVDYETYKPEIEFFSNFPRLTVSEYNRLFDGVDDMPDIKTAKERRMKLTLQNLLTKHKQWSIEKEVRMFSVSPFARDLSIDPSIDERQNTIQYPIKSLKGVIFGARTPRIDAEAVLEVLLTKHFAVPISSELIFSKASMMNDGSLVRRIYAPFIGWQGKYSYPQR